MTDEWANAEEDVEDEQNLEALQEQFEEEQIEWARGGFRNSEELRRVHEFHLAAEYVAIALAGLPSVRRVVLFGSVAVPLEREKPRHRTDREAGLTFVWHHCDDIDLAVWVDDLTNLRALQKARGKALGFLHAAHGFGVAHHQVEIFLMEPGTDRYLGRLCTFGACPRGKRECEERGCGRSPFVKVVPGFKWRSDALHPAFSVLLYDTEEAPGLRDSVLQPVLKG